MTPRELPAPTGAPTPRPSRPSRPPAPAPAPVGPIGPGGATPPRPTSAVRSRPDPRPMRLGLGAAAIAALTVMVGGMVRFPAADAPVDAGDELTADTGATVAVRVEKRIRYVQLRRGQKAPPGAKVIDAAQPTPRVIVTRIQQPAPVRKRTTTRTRQSGRR